MPKKKSPFTKDAAHALVIEQLKKKHEEEVAKLVLDKAKIFDEMLKSKNNTVASIQKTHAEELARVKTEARKNIDEATAEMWRQRELYEKTHVEMLQALHGQGAIKAWGDHWEKLYKEQNTELMQRGSRRAQWDPNYAVIRELLHAGKDLSKIDILALSKAHPEATIFGLVQIAEEFGVRIKMDVKMRDEAAKQSTSRWSWGDGVSRAYIDILSTMVMDDAGKKAVEEISKDEDEKVLKETRP